MPSIKIRKVMIMMPIRLRLYLMASQEVQPIQEVKVTTKVHFLQTRKEDTGKDPSNPLIMQVITRDLLYFLLENKSELQEILQTNFPKQVHTNVVQQMTIKV